jgi:AraC-like DNA-binding protein
MQAELDGRPMDWLQVDSGRRYVPWMQADVWSRRIARRLSVTSVWAGGRTVDGPKHHLDTGDPEVSALSDALTFCLVRDPLPSRERAPDASIRRAIELMTRSFSEPLTIDALARAAELPRFVFLRRFRAQMGTSPYRALTELRLERAAKQLRTSSASILEVCLSCGFGDPSRSARMFRQRYGCTPLRFRGEQNPAAHETPVRRTNR